jgi:predicted CXXCH cytochrome family protein
MRKSALFAFVVGCFVSFSIGVGSAAADNGPHLKGQGLTPDTCAACHRAHTGKAPYNLKENQEALCFTCHGSTGTGSNLDVQDGVGYSGTARSGGAAGALRGGGFKYALINTSEPKPVRTETGKLVEATIPALGTSELKETTSAHSVDESSQIAWGNGAISATSEMGKSINLSCGSCHDPHGNGNYRILRPIPVASGAASPGVTIPDATTKVYTTTNYWASWDTNQMEFQYKISEWCSTCHTRLLAASGSGNANSGDATYTYRHRTSYTKEEYEKSPPPKAKPNCIQCHVSHGTDATMGENSSGVPFPNGVVGKGTSFLLRLDNRGVCQTCHNK